jgi:hypothetical protein
MAAAKTVNSIAYNLMNAHLINLSSALDFLVYALSQGVNVLYLLLKVVVALFLCVQMACAVLNAKTAKITSR